MFTMNIEMFFAALEKKYYKCALKADQLLPMMYIDDTISATVKFLKADNSKLTRRVYNLGCISFTPG